MTRRERLMSTLRGEPVDRPAVSFYEIGGWKPDPDDPDPYNIYNDPSWRPLLALAENRTDLIRMVPPITKPAPGNPVKEFAAHESWEEHGSRFFKTTINVAGRTLTSLSRRDPEVDTVWTIEHLIKNVDDLKAFLQLPDEYFDYEADVSNLIKAEEEVGDRGIVMVDFSDPICYAAGLFSMDEYTITAMMEPDLFHALLKKYARRIYPVAEYVSEAFPGHLWRICGPEYATEPYLPPTLFKDYVYDYCKPIVEIIKKHGGYARIHSHGRLKNVLPYIADMGADGIDPIEPPPQGDVELADVRRDYGQQLVLFGNIEVTDIENMEPSEFEKVVAKSIADGTSGQGRGFVLMPSASPYGRTITPTTMANYETMLRLVESLG
ncbi:MAG TPA: uroporphyrinogen decarboxylase family protein [Armatimonadota bacterium]|nr:uroporphyrinogen decarboxylase family protein [Armatimonadota bacterium]